MDGDFIPGMVALTISNIDYRSTERCGRASGLLSLKASSSSSNNKRNKKNCPPGNVECFSIDEIDRTGLMQNEANERSKYVNCLKRCSDQGGKTVSNKRSKCRSLSVNISSNLETHHNSPSVENMMDCLKSKKANKSMKKKMVKKAKAMKKTMIDNEKVLNSNIEHAESRIKNKKSFKKRKHVNLNDNICEMGGPIINESNIDVVMKSGNKMSLKLLNNEIMQNLNIEQVEPRIKNKKSAKKRKSIVNMNDSMYDGGGPNSNESNIDVVMKCDNEVSLKLLNNGKTHNLKIGNTESKRKKKKTAKKIKCDININDSTWNEVGPKNNEFNVDFVMGSGNQMSFSMKKMKQSIKNIERASHENNAKHNSQNEYRDITYSKSINKNIAPKVNEVSGNGAIAPNSDDKGTKSCTTDNAKVGFKQKTIVTAFKKINESLDMRTIFVGNLSKKLNRRNVKRLFSHYGKVECVRFRCPPLADPRVPKKVAVIKQDYHADRSNITAYVRFTSVEDAKKALVANGTVVCGHHIRVDMATADPNHDYKKAIFIGNLSYAVEEEELWKMFEMCGPIESIRVVRDQVANIGRGYAYVNFKSADAVELALNMEGQLVGDREMRIKRSTHIKKGTKTIKRARGNLYKKMLQADSKKHTSVAEASKPKYVAKCTTGKQKNIDTSHSYEGKKTAETKSLKPEMKNNKTKKKRKSRSMLKKAKLIQTLARM